MGKRSRTKQQRRTHPAEAPQPAVTETAVGPRQPCPCGSGRRYKACHGSQDAVTPFVTRAFEGLPGECDWVAMREFVPAASAALPLAGGDRTVMVCSVLPAMWPAMVREDGTVWLALQVQQDSGDASRDLAWAFEQAASTEPGSPVTLPGLPGPGTRLQDLVAGDAGFEVTVHDGFDFWVADVDDPSGQIAASLEQANAAMTPTRRLGSVEAAYWCDVGTKEHLRWVMPHPEEQLLAALARLHARRKDALVPDSRLVGSFRAHGLVVPVWDLPVGTGAEALEEPAAAFADRLDAALGDDAPLTSPERSALAGLRNRQLTIR
jgi:hypothetical protein